MDPEKTKAIQEWEAPISVRGGTEQEQSFVELKKAFLSEEVLAAFDPEKRTIVECDSSRRAIGAVLLQEGADGTLQLQGVREFEVVTDYKNLEYFTHKQKLSERHVRWNLELARFPNMRLRYRPGKENPPNLLELIQDHWDEATQADSVYQEVKAAVRENKRSLLSSRKIAISLGDCTIDEEDKLRWRDRIWVLDYEPLRTGVI
ncbi:hypothetical protein P3342_007326 [Pyrenophora teres f. teres]|nr:hypothetical protein P3342_007326 [Pyrenophora teres f. teres]